MSTPKDAPTIIVPGSGDKPTNTPGHVTPGMSLRQRAGIEPKKKPDAEPADPKPKPTAKPKPAPAPAAPVLDQEAITAAATTAAVAAVKATEKPAPVAPPEPKETDGLTPAQVKKYNVMAHMESLNPGNKGLAAKFAANAKKLDAYQKEWEGKNRGKKFNSADPEHEEFLADVDVTYDQDEYVEALTDLKAEEKAKASLAPIQERQKKEDDERARAARVAEVEPEAAAFARSQSKSFFDELGSEFADIMDDQNRLKPGALEQIKAHEYSAVIIPAGRNTEIVTAELKRIDKGASVIDPKKPTQLHEHICQFVYAQDAEMKKLPPEDQMRDGKKFASTDEWAAMSPQKRAHYWSFSADDLSRLYASEQADHVKKHIEAKEAEINQIAQKRGWLPQEKTVEQPKKLDLQRPNGGNNGFPQLAERQNQPQIQRREPSPAVTSAPRMAAPPKSDANGTKNFRQRLGIA